MTTSFNPHTSAARLLATLRDALDVATAALARRCAPNGRLDVQQLDTEQVPSFELAWASAELLAAESVLKALGTETSDLDRRLALIFAVEAITLVRNRLEALHAELDLPSEALHAVMLDPDLRRLQKHSLSGASLHAVARLLSRDSAALARVPVREELALVRDQFSRFAANAVAPLAERIHRRDLIVPEEELLKPLREMGVFGLSIPEKYGGSAPNDAEDSLTMIVVTEALSQASLGVAGSLITRPEILARALLSGGTEVQKQHWLPRVAQGDPLCAIAITEPDCGSDVARLSLRGTHTDGGWLLNGTKTWCTFAGKAGLMMVVTRTNPDRSLRHKGLSLLLVEKPSYEGHDFDYQQEHGGRLSGRAIPTIGYRGMHSFDISLENFFVPDANGGGSHADCGARQRRNASGAARWPEVFGGQKGIRRVTAQPSADRRKARKVGGTICCESLPDLRGRKNAECGRRAHGGESGEAIGLPLRRTGDSRNAADSRWHGLRRGSRSEPLLCRCACADHL